MSRLSVANIADAATRIDPVFLNSPQIVTQRYGLELLLKVETANPIKSFKGRGAEYYIATQPDSCQRVVAASAGNFGQGLAYAARKRGITADVFAATTASPVKLQAMQGFGANVHLEGHDFDAAKLAAKQYAAEHGLQFAEDGRHPRFSEGAGTIGIELAPWQPDILVIPLGNGALLGGIACWMKAHSPKTKIIGACAAAAPSMEQSWRRGHKPTETETATTIADGIAVRIPIPEAVQDLSTLMDDCLLIGERRIKASMRTLYRDFDLIAEGSGAIGLAAVELMADRWRALRVATIVCGGNLTPEQIENIR